jgi:CBS-domain-containing membrane protein
MATIQVQEQLPAPRVVQRMGEATVADLLKDKSKRSELIVVPSPGGLLILNADMTLDDAMETLSKHEIHAAPVRDQATKKILGWLTQFDLVSFVVRHYADGKDILEADKVWAQYKRAMQKLEHKGQKVGKTPIRNVVENWEAPYNKLHVVSPQMKLWQVLDEYFAPGFHRVAVGEDENNLRDIISQSDIIKFIAMHLDDLQNLGDQPIQELLQGKFISHNFAPMRMDTDAIHAFYLMATRRVAAVPVLDDESRVVAVVSGADIKRIHSKNFAVLLQPLIQFLTSNPAQILPPVLSKPDSKLRTIIQQLAIFRIHQVFIVDDASKAVGVVTLQNVMRLLDSFTLEA